MDTHYRLAHLTLVSRSQTLLGIITQTSTGGVWCVRGVYINAGMNTTETE